jgi:4-aminobutyrate aminotransferase-like enzyme
MITRCNWIDASKSNRRILQGEIHHVINPDPYRGIFGSDPTGYAKDVQDHIDYGTSGKVAGFISETIQVGDLTLTLVSSKTLMLVPSKQRIWLF